MPESLPSVCSILFTAPQEFFNGFLLILRTEADEFVILRKPEITRRAVNVAIIGSHDGNYDDTCFSIQFQLFQCPSYRRTSLTDLNTDVTFGILASKDYPVKKSGNIRPDHLIGDPESFRSILIDLPSCSHKLQFSFSRDV